MVNTIENTIHMGLAGPSNGITLPTYDYTIQEVPGSASVFLSRVEHHRHFITIKTISI